MSFRVLPDGVILCDSADEALDLRDRELARRRAHAGPQVSLPHVAPKTNGHVIPPARTGPPVFWERLGAKQVDVLKLVKANPGGIDVDTIVATLHLESGTQLAGIVGGGIARGAERAGLEPSAIYYMRKAGNARIYYPGPLLMEKDLS